MFSTQELESIKELISKRKRIVILTHNNPDGDAIGSSLALYHFLKTLGQQPKIIVPNQFPKFLKWLPEADKIFIAEYDKDYNQKLILNAQIIFNLDFNTFSRIDFLADTLKEAKGIKILIDHHQAPETFDFIYSDTQMPATCEMIFHFISALGLEENIDKDIAECIYTGIVTDTGNFKYKNIKSSTLFVASKLLGKGVDNEKINTYLFDSGSENKLKLLGLVLKRIQVYPEIGTSILYVTKDELLSHKFQKGDTEGFVNYGLSIEGVDKSVFLSEDLHKDFVKMSFRSLKEIDMNTFARKYFNGGGHINAAGGRSNHSLEETIKEVVQKLELEFLN